MSQLSVDEVVSLEIEEAEEVLAEETPTYHGIRLAPERDGLMDEYSLTLLRRYYMQPGEKSPQESYARAALAYSAGDLALAQRIYDYASRQWFMFSSPVLSNAPAPGGSWKGLPISCFLTFVDDTIRALIEHGAETAWLSVKGGGVGGHWSKVRSPSDKSPGPIPFLKTIDAEMLAYAQGSTRRGSYAAYLDVSHPDLLEFLEMRTPVGGDPNRKTFALHHAVNITDEFMEACLEDKKWHLRDPHTGEIKATMWAQELFEKILTTRMETGEPYLHFIDTSNRALPQALKDLGLRIWGSNLCIEIFLPTSVDRTAVCCLSSLNLEHFDAWRDTQIVQDLIRFLDNVLEIFIQNAPPELHKAVHSARQERSLGLGTLGFHSYLQRHMIPWESALAVGANQTMFSLIHERAIESTKQLARERGPYLDDPTGDRRNSHLLALAPNANSGVLANSSASIEAIASNEYSHKMRAGIFRVRNKYLDRLLKAKGLEGTELAAVWESVRAAEGSVQHLDVLDSWEKDVFKTAFELDQMWVVQHAIDRQPFVCQGQSLNLFFPPGTDKSYLLATHVKAWKGGLKGLYYLRSESPMKVDISSRVQREPLTDYVQHEECLACHG